MRLPLLALALLLAPGALAQTFTSSAWETPVGVSDLARLGTGGAVVALPTLDSPFTSNPAHVGVNGFRLNVLGATVGAGGNVRETYDFYADDLGPAIEEGLDQIRTSDPDRLAALYADALRIGSSSKTTDLAVLAPSVQIVTGPVSLGVGIYGQGTSRGRIVNGGAGIPLIDAYAQADVSVPVVAALDLSRAAPGALPFGLRVGASATYLQRRVSAKYEAIDGLDPDGEKIYVFRADAVRLAAGLYARDVGVPGLDLGAEVSNVGGAMDYAFEQSIEVSGSEGVADDAAEVARLERQFDGREASAVVSVGAAYRLPLNMVPGLSGAAVALDYTSASTADSDQSLQAGLRAGVRASLAGLLHLRAGLSQGMPSAGVGVGTRWARLEYATYGVEDGRLLGQSQRRNHVAQLRLGWF